MRTTDHKNILRNDVKKLKKVKASIVLANCSDAGWLKWFLIKLQKSSQSIGIKKYRFLRPHHFKAKTTSIGLRLRLQKFGLNTFITRLNVIVTYILHTSNNCALC